MAHRNVDSEGNTLLVVSVTFFSFNFDNFFLLTGVSLEVVSLLVRTFQIQRKSPTDSTKQQFYFYFYFEILAGVAQMIFAIHNLQQLPDQSASIASPLVFFHCWFLNYSTQTITID